MFVFLLLFVFVFVFVYHNLCCRPARSRFRFVQTIVGGGFPEAAHARSTLDPCNQEMLMGV